MWSAKSRWWKTLQSLIDFLDYTNCRDRKRISRWRAQRMFDQVTSHTVWSLFGSWLGQIFKLWANPENLDTDLMSDFEKWFIFHGQVMVLFLYFGEFASLRDKHGRIHEVWPLLQNNAWVPAEASLVALLVKNTCRAGDLGSIPRSARSPGEGNDYPLQYSSLRYPMEKWAWRAIVHGVAELDTTEWLGRTLPGERTEGYRWAVSWSLLKMLKDAWQLMIWLSLLLYMSDVSLV